MRHVLSIIIPVFNEQLAVKDIVLRTHDVIEPSDEIIVINDGSTDRTGAALASLNLPNLRVITHDRNKGNGASILDGALAATGEWVVTIDADMTYFPEDIPSLFAELKRRNLEMITGARQTLRLGPLSHRIARELLRRWAQLLSGAAIGDINSGLRILPRSRLLKYRELYPARFSLHIVLTVCCGIDGVLCGSFPIRYGSRIGVSKLSPGLRGIGNFFKFLLLVPKAAYGMRRLASKEDCHQ